MYKVEDAAMVVVCAGVVPQNNKNMKYTSVRRRSGQKMQKGRNLLCVMVVDGCDVITKRNVLRERLVL
jgi:hypothetical protein